VVQNWASQISKINQLRANVQNLVWQSAGICREQEVLEHAIATLETLQSEFTALPLSQQLLHLSPTQTVQFDLSNTDRQLRTWGETRNLVDVGYLILKSALFRTESRGGHYRIDYPTTHPNWQVHTLVKNHQWWKSPLINTESTKK
jgi:L-aspartate oxidase